jgi:hypothetical protein
MTSRDRSGATMSTKTPDTQPPMPGSELFFHDVDAAPA